MTEEQKRGLVLGDVTDPEEIQIINVVSDFLVKGGHDVEFTVIVYALATQSATYRTLKNLSGRHRPIPPVEQRVKELRAAILAQIGEKGKARG